MTTPGDVRDIHENKIKMIPLNYIGAGISETQSGKSEIKLQVRGKLLLSDANELSEWHTATVTGFGENPAILVSFSKRYACYKVQDLSLTGSRFHLFKNHQWFEAVEKFVIPVSRKRMKLGKPF